MLETLGVMIGEIVKSGELICLIPLALIFIGGLIFYR